MVLLYNHYQWTQYLSSRLLSYTPVSFKSEVPCQPGFIYNQNRGNKTPVSFEDVISVYDSARAGRCVEELSLCQNYRFHTQAKNRIQQNHENGNR